VFFSQTAKDGRLLFLVEEVKMARTFTEYVPFACSPMHVEALRRLAREVYGESRSAVLRSLVREAARERGLWPDGPKEDKEDDEKQNS
jgi:hypothetical protein